NRAEVRTSDVLSIATPNFRSRTLFHGDNLPFLRGMHSKSVHLIATDPPFNRHRDFHATPDARVAHDSWTAGAGATTSMTCTAYPTASHYLKALFDGIFGQDNFRNGVVRKRTAQGFKDSQFQPRTYNTNTDAILFYARTAHVTFYMSRVLEPHDPDYLATAFKLEDDKGRYYLDLVLQPPKCEFTPKSVLCEYRILSAASLQV
ncbi:MAG: hypothetical protein OXC95_13025, partial [Dehalococcoidia bacterium]|nr:hypothetical protein [Dehalococcoidia bacterium]